MKSCLPSCSMPLLQCSNFGKMNIVTQQRRAENQMIYHVGVRARQSVGVRSQCSKVASCIDRTMRGLHQKAWP